MPNRGFAFDSTDVSTGNLHIGGINDSYGIRLRNHESKNRIHYINNYF